MAAASKDSEKRHKRRGMLKDYYGIPGENESEPFDPYNINGSDFNPDLFLNKLIKECSLQELMTKETEIYKQIQCLDSEMQTLVYENYNKFISATDTIRKMKNDFKKMEEEMDHLATNMSSITEFSENISSTLQGRREIISKLSGTHTILKKLQFLFELPPRLKKKIEAGSFGKAVRMYTKAEKVLSQYQHMPSFHGIQEDCDILVKQLKCKLWEHFHLEEATPKQIAECVDLLLQLREPAEQLCDEFLAHTKQKLDADLLLLEQQIQLQLGEGIIPSGDTERPSDKYPNLPMDILEFVDLGCNQFLSNICLVIASYSEMFLNRLPCFEEQGEAIDGIAMEKLITFVMLLMERYFVLVEKRVSLEKETGDNTILVRALDRFHRRLQITDKLLPDTDFSRTGMQIVCRAAKEHCERSLKSLEQHLSECLTDVRHNLAAPRTLSQEGSTLLSDLLSTLRSSVCDQVQSVLTNLKAFVRPEITFAIKTHFRDPFCRDYVREGVVVAFIRHINQTAQDFCSCVNDKNSTPPPALLLLLSRFCRDLGTTSIAYLLEITDEQFDIEDKLGLTDTADICANTKDKAQCLLDHFVRLQGLNISQMLRKSVETRDWMNTIEPRTVRAVMKRVVEDLTTIDSQVGQLYEEGTRRERSSDSSRRTFPYSTTRQPPRSNWSAYAPSVDNSLISNIQKLFSEKIEIFSKVEFSKVSVMTGIVKISLKTFLECVRLRTFSRFGLQQVQVDTHYLQLYLWRFVADENLVHVLLDEILGSSIHRCVDAVMMEPSVIEVICERG